MKNGGHPDPLSAAKIGVTEYGTLSKLLISKIIPLFASDKVPTDIKVFMGILLFTILYFSAGLAILLANVVVCIVQAQEIRFEYYLIYVGVVGLLLFSSLLGYSGRARRFENTRILEDKMEDITRSRRGRQKSPQGIDETSR
jgi:hypothetical protein